MTPTRIEHHFHQYFKFLWTALLLAALVFSGLPLSTAQAASAAVSDGSVKSPPKAPLFAPDVSVALSIHPLERVMIGEDFDFYLTFDNPNPEVGYGPFIDLVFSSNGADGAAGTDTPDGIDFVSAQYESYTLPATTLVFPDDDGPGGPGTTGCVAHPLAVDNTGTAVQVCGTAGDTLVVLELPFSSFRQAMPRLYVDVTAHVSNLANVDTPLTLLGRGGYRFGADNLNNPIADPAILNPSSTDGSGWPSLQVTPRVIHIEKDFNGPAECPYLLAPSGPILDETQCYGDVNPVYESVSGPNFPRQYIISVCVAAPGNPVTNVDVTDYFPNTLAYLSSTPAPASAPPVGIASNGAQLVTQFASLASGSTTTITVDFYIPEFDGDSNPVLDPITGASAVADNTGTAIGDWTPVDTRDPGGPDNGIANGPLCPGDCVTLNELNIRSIAVQKLVAIETDNGAPGYSPGDLLKYILYFQISDYFTYGDPKLTDVLTDGQRVGNPGGAFPPIFSVSDRNTTLIDQNFTYTAPPGAAAPGDDLIIDESQIGNSGTLADGTDGSTTLTSDISKAMTNAALVDGILQGGEAGATGAVPAVGTITFYATIQEDFSDDYPSGDQSVDHGDVLFNSVVLDGTLRDDTTITTVLGNQSNDSAQKIKIVYDGLDKSIYAVNGSTSFSSPFTTPAAVHPGDTITFRLSQSLPSSDSDNLVLIDFLPLPIFDAAEITAFDNMSSGTPPAAGHAQYDSTSTLNTALLAAPTPTINADATNGLSFDFGSFDDLTDTTSEVDILFTVTVSDAPYVYGAVLTNLGLGLEDTTNSYQHLYIGTDQFTLKEPGISLRKGVVASNNAAAVFTPNPPGPVTFNAPGSNPSWSGVIASGDNDPGTSLINSDIANVNSGDLVTFAVVFENLGHSSLGAFDVSVKDSLPADLVIPAGGINLQARRGDGAAISFTPVGSTATEPSGLFDAGIIFNDESPTQGAAHVYDATTGQNTIVITYDLQIAANLTAGTSIVNTATVLSYAGTEGGPNHVGVAPTNNVNSDDATATLPNTAPVITEGTSINITMSEAASPTPFALTLHATDANGDPLTWSIFSAPVYGTAGASAGVISYVPYIHYSGADSFVVQVTDGVLSDQINVYVTVQPERQDSELIWNQSYAIRYDSWIGAQDPNAFGGKYRMSRSGAFTLKPIQKFTNVTWITYVGPDQGKAKVYVDGALKKTIDLYSATANWQYPIVITGLKNTAHTIIIKAMNARNAASSDKWVVVDGFKVGSTTYDDNNIGISGMYSYESWLGLVDKHARFNAYRISSVKNATLQFSFLGTRFNWVTARGPIYGKALIYVDGVPVKTVDLYRASQQWRYRVIIPNLTYGQHIVQIKVLHTKNSASTGFGVVCDGFEIY